MIILLDLHLIVLISSKYSIITINGASFRVQRCGSPFLEIAWLSFSLIPELAT